MSNARTLPWGLALPADGAGLDHDLRVLSKTGRVLCALALDVTLYIEHGDRPEVRSAMVGAYERYLQLGGSALLWGADPDSGEPVELATSTLGDVRNWPQPLFQRFDFQMTFHGGRDVDDADAQRVIAVSREREVGQLSYLSLSLPLTWAREHAPSEFVAWVVELCNRLDPAHGYAGIAALGPVAGIDDEAAHAIYGVGRRLRGVDLDFPAQHEPYLASERRIKGAGWLTVLGASKLAELGGLQRLNNAIGSATLHPFGDPAAHTQGAVVQAGLAPRLGRDGEPMDVYGRVARALRPVSSANPAVIWPQGMPGFDFDEARDWMTRFDRM